MDFYVGINLGLMPSIIKFHSNLKPIVPSSTGQQQGEVRPTFKNNWIEVRKSYSQSISYSYSNLKVPTDGNLRWTSMVQAQRGTRI